MEFVPVSKNVNEEEQFILLLNVFSPVIDSVIELVLYTKLLSTYDLFTIDVVLSRFYEVHPVN